jgi:hypothetical protein
MIQEVKDVIELEELYLRRIVDYHQLTIAEMVKDIAYLRSIIASLKKQNTALNERVMQLEGSKGQF